MEDIKSKAPRPAVRLVGEDGNAFAILAKCKRAATRSGWSDERWAEFHSEATRGDYDNLLGAVMKWFDVT